MRPFVLHLDLDQFIAAVEILRRPELEGRPVIVGGDGDPTKRGVVSTASYEARRYGVRSGMALRTALKRCPDAVFLPVDAPAYHAASKDVMDTLRSFDAVVQEMGWDEAFLGVETNDPEALAHEIQRAVLERTRLWSTIGIGDNKLQAKLASEAGKPRGVFRLTSDRWREWMDARPTDALWGVGTKTAAKLARIGIRTVAQLADADPTDVAAAFGPRTGPWLQELARGEGSSHVSAEPWVPRAVSREHTFQQDLTDGEEIAQELDRIARDTAGDVAKDGRDAARVVGEVGVAPRTPHNPRGPQGPPGPAPPAPPRPPAPPAPPLARFDERPGRPVRLLGVRAEFDHRT